MKTSTPLLLPITSDWNILYPMKNWKSASAVFNAVVFSLVGLALLVPAANAVDSNLAFSKGVTAYDENNYAQARKFFEQACNSGVADGCYGLGVMFERGKGGKQDEIQARSLYDQACQGGHTNGCYNLGVAFEQGIGGKKDKAQARLLYEIACKAGIARSCTKPR